jgi:predicted SnoaL-like aldol condensation-catalyzing enzyme
MKIRLIFLTLSVFACGSVLAQEPVVGVADPEALFHDKNPKLNANKQVAYHIMLDLLECNHWNEADKWLTAEYHQHNPLAASGRDGVVKFFSARKPTPLPSKMQTKIVAVMADGDLVMVATPRSFDDPRKPGEKYYTTWFDMWRIKDGKADEHWDGQTVPVPNASGRGR